MSHGFIVRSAVSLVGSLVTLGSSAIAATIHVPADQPTIQAAVDAALMGDEIVLAKGTYKEDVSISGKSFLVIRAEGKAEIRGSGSAGVPALSIEGGTNVTLTNLRFKKTKSDAVRVQSFNVLIQDCRFDSIGGRAIFLVSSQSCTVDSCLIKKTKSDAIGTDSSTLITISENEIIDAGNDAISLSVGGTLGPSDDCTIVGNLIRKPKDDGVDIRGNDNTIQDNDVKDAGEDAFEVDIESSGIGNDFVANFVSEPKKVAFKLGGGLNRVESNLIVKTGGDSIQLRGTGGHTALLNTIQDPKIDGIWVQFGSDGNTIQSNTVMRATDDGIDVESDNNTIDGNDVRQSKKSGLEIEGVNSQVMNNLFQKSKQLDIHDLTGGNNTYTNNTYTTSDLP